MNILVTGGAGYIGSIVVEELVKAGERVIVYDSLSQGHRDAVDPRATFIKGDLADVVKLEATFQQHNIEAVMHFASSIVVPESVTNPLLYFRNNVACGLYLFEAMLRHGVKRFILSSTANLFSEPERMPVDEEERIVPGSPYGESKFILERMLHWLDQSHGLRYAALRYFNAAGASPDHGEDHNPETHLIPLVLKVALGQREHIEIYGTRLHPRY
jgi:UDP-glucose 4-epimerase